MFTPKGFDVFLRVSRMAWRRASGEGWVRAVRMPVEKEERVRMAGGGKREGRKRTESSGVGYGGGELGDSDPVQSLINSLSRTIVQNSLTIAFRPEQRAYKNFSISTARTTLGVRRHTLGSRASS